MNGDERLPIGTRLERVKAVIPKGVTLIAVSKTHPSAAVLEAYHAGQRLFGENKVQEMTLKYNELPKDIEWHFIGHVQTNKIRLMAPYVSMIHGMDTFDKLVEADRQAARYGRRIKCLLQIHIAQEETKFGFTPQECMDMLAEGRWRELENITLSGVMGMASFTSDTAQVRDEFRTLSTLFHRAEKEFFQDYNGWNTMSAGMSGDWREAVEEGSNMVRIGTTIFGERDYTNR